MTEKPRLMTRLDQAAEALLERHFAPVPEGVAPVDPELQIKAFDSVVKYFGPRTKLGPNENKEASEFERLQDHLHGRTARRKASRRRRRSDVEFDEQAFGGSALGVDAEFGSESNGSEPAHLNGEAAPARDL